MFTDKLLTEIETKKRGLYQRAVELFDSSAIIVNVNGIESPYREASANVNIEWTANL